MPANLTDCVEHRCLKVADDKSFVGRAQRSKINAADLRRLVDVVDGQCMVCRVCHAQVLDGGRIGSQTRGVVCRCCRTRLSVSDGASGNLLAAVADFCYCRPGTQEWDARASLATRDYLRRAAQVAAACEGPREQFAELARRVERDGLDAGEAWSAPMPAVQERLATTQAAVEASDAFTEFDRTIPPLQRGPCPVACVQHQTHLYICCFDVPTRVRSRDYHPDDRQDYPLEHYVGFTSRVPPLRRLRDHGQETVRGLVLLVPGVIEEEDHLKRESACPRCGAPLWYFRVALTRL